MVSLAVHVQGGLLSISCHASYVAHACEVQPDVMLAILHVKLHSAYLVLFKCLITIVLYILQNSVQKVFAGGFYRYAYSAASREDKEIYCMVSDTPAAGQNTSNHIQQSLLHA